VVARSLLPEGLIKHNKKWIAQVPHNLMRTLACNCTNRFFTAGGLILRHQFRHVTCICKALSQVGEHKSQLENAQNTSKLEGNYSPKMQ
jgi:hypothetical protein